MAGNGTASSLSPAMLEAVKRRRRALELRQAGLTWDQISEQMRWDRRNLIRAVKAELKKVTAEPAQEVLDLELSRLDAIVRALWPQVLRGDHGAIDRLLRTMDRRARYMGLDHVPGGERDAADVDRWLKQVSNGAITGGPTLDDGGDV